MMLKKRYIHRLVLAMAGILLGFSSCDEPFEGVFVASDEVSAANWLLERPEYSDWVEILRRVDSYNAYNTSASKNTFFVANNEALQRFAEERAAELGADYTSIFDLPEDDLRKLVEYNSIPDYAVLSKNMYGNVSRKTTSGDYITAGYNVDRNLRYINNGDGFEDSFLIDADIEVINGLIHVVDRPLRPIFETVWDIIMSNPEEYTIFIDAVKAAGDSLKNFLQREEATVYWGPEGSKRYYTYRDYKTVFVVPNSEYQAFGIYDFNQLMSEYFPNDIDNPSNPNGDFFHYMFYHIMHKRMSYADLTTFPRTPRDEGTSYTTHMTLYPMSNKKGISVRDQGDIIFNQQDMPFTINPTRRDIPGNNGYVHEIVGSIMAIPERMARYAVEIEFTDKIEFSAIDFYQSDKPQGQTADTWRIYPDDIPGISWIAVPMNEARVWYSNEYMAAGKAGNHNSGIPKGDNRYKNHDAIYWDLGATGSITFRLPPTPRGQNYRIYVVKSNDQYKGGKYAVRWGTQDMGNDRNFMGGDETAEWGTKNPSLEEETNFRLRLSQVTGEAGIDRIILMPEGDNDDLK